MGVRSKVDGRLLSDEDAWIQDRFAAEFGGFYLTNDVVSAC